MILVPPFLRPSVSLSITLWEISPERRRGRRRPPRMVDIRYRSFSGAGRNLEVVNVRRLSENYSKMYVDKSTSSQYLSWAPPSATPPPFLIERIVQQQRDPRPFGKAAEPNKEVAEVPRSKNKRGKLWWNDSELKRRRRIAKYKLYGAEGKMKMSFKRGCRWFKRKCYQIVSNF